MYDFPYGQIYVYTWLLLVSLITSAASGVAIALLIQSFRAEANCPWCKFPKVCPSEEEAEG